MKYAAAIILGFAISAAQICCAQDAYDTTQAEAAAGAWLALTDVGNASASWDQANERFKSRLDKLIGRRRSTPCACRSEFSEHARDHRPSSHDR
jgi:hypothetical protein